MIFLTNQQAQDIVDKMMNVIPYNVNIINEKGIIIGSGDHSRIGSIHEGAIEALEKNKMVEIYKEHGGAKKGVNTPIRFGEKVVGVIGISGDPEVVRSFVELVRVTAELLINQEYVLSVKKINEQIKEEFLYEWTYLSGEYSTNFIERGLSIGIDVTLKRRAVVINIKNLEDTCLRNNINKFLREQEFWIRLNPETILLFMISSNKLIKRIEKFIKDENYDLSAGLGFEEKIMANSVKQAVKALSFGEKLQPLTKVHDYKELSFIATLADYGNDKEIISIVETIENKVKNSDLMETLITYITLNGEINTTAETLHIHRNSLNYRLEKIQEITGKNPRNYIDLFQLFTAYIMYKLKSNT